MTSNISVPAAARTVQLLELLLANPQGVTPQECLTHLDVTRSTLFALLQTLKTLGYIDQRKSRGRYRPGPRLMAWRGSMGSDPRDLLTAFHQEATSSQMEETLALAVLTPPHILILAQRESTQHVRTSYDPGQPINKNESAAGYVLDPSPDEAIRTTGYHLYKSRDALELSIPICEDGYHPRAALLLSAPSFRYKDAAFLSFLPLLREMAARLSYRLGASVYAPYKGPVLPKIESAAPLSPDEIHAFLQGPWVARLACVQPNGMPHVIPVWQEFNEGVFYIASWGGSRWAEYLLSNPSVSLTVDEPWPPLRRVSAQGVAQALEDQDYPEGTFAILNRLSQRFLGQALHPDTTSQPWQAFRIQPEELRGWRGLKSGAQ
jgi:DNA-binding IclR family transcriptional regulator/nitroimidazol reductase NimA-like FMN-containing flavoprotein (pyridoxamine 5'-phosphate oxidase superfamily)